MKKTTILLAAFLCAVSLSAKELKVLMIGNSFSNSVKTFLPKVVQSSGKHTLILGSASIGGCSLERHCSNIDKEQKDTTKTADLEAALAEKSEKLLALEAEIEKLRADLIYQNKAERVAYAHTNTFFIMEEKMGRFYRDAMYASEPKIGI